MDSSCEHSKHDPFGRQQKTRDKTMDVCVSLDALYVCQDIIRMILVIGEAILFSTLNH